ncbi:hypothetical protein JW859_08680 [bacterium]|nr:hypothetical protein [bacterium]
MLTLALNGFSLTSWALLQGVRGTRLGVYLLSGIGVIGGLGHLGIGGVAGDPARYDAFGFLITYALNHLYNLFKTEPLVYLSYSWFNETHYLYVFYLNNFTEIACKYSLAWLVLPMQTAIIVGYYWLIRGLLVLGTRSKSRALSLKRTSDG